MVRKETIRCYKCHKDSGVQKNSLMVIPPEGLKCVHCGTVIYFGAIATNGPVPEWYRK